MEHFSKILMKHKLNIFIGAYGSGKSEISVNSALLLKKENPINRLHYTKCRDCAGTGYSFGGQCERCEGTGDEDYGRRN